MKRTSRFETAALIHLAYWAKENRKLLLKAIDLLEDCCRNPYEGIGKPEPLKGDFQGCWSRRIDQEHRLIYKVTDEDIVVVSMKGHYD